MRMIEPLLMEFDRECSTTRKVLSRVPGDKLSWKPHAKSYSLGQLANHIAGLPHWIGGSLLPGEFDTAKGGGDFSPKEAVSTEAVLKTFDESVAAAKAAMAQLDDGRAMGAWKLRHGDKVMLEMPRIALVRTILLNHSIHHRGQLSVYLRLLDVPVPAIYGPSADEKAFG
ncbi:MAG TPA: DinB family protein [Thermoanaerobaculia bacterium]|nr:DinB family protein [Thermoanaerobaculia bacterium]